ncbi:MAG: gliding motility-associated C-terminal domain-containing protein [Vicingus serpentipes]|nr:gliding motility-associated C-terminal domain-containing protein [Vicingus serpentipes]
MNNFLPKTGTFILKSLFGITLLIGANNILAQNTCASPVSLTIGVDDNDCNSVSFGSLGQDLDNIPVAVSGSTCGVGADHAASWYTFTGDGNTIRVKLFGQTNLSRILVFENQACSGTMTAMTCGGQFPDDDLPHTVDVNTTNGATYLVAVFRGSGSATMSGNICAYNTNGNPYSTVCDFLWNIPPTDITVQTDDLDCFTNYTTVITSDDDLAGNNGDRPGPVTGCNTNVEYWWGKFTAVSNLTKFYLWGKDDPNADFIVTNGPCMDNMPNLLCQTTGADDAPSYYELATVIGQEYYTIVRGPMDYARLCVYSEDSTETDKPFCNGGLSFEDGTGTGWNAAYGSYHLVSAPGNTWIWDNSVVGYPLPANQGAITSGTGFDPSVGGMLPVVAPGGGNNSFRLGSVATVDAFGPVTIPGMPDGLHSASAEMSFCFTVDPNNAAFGYKYAVIMDYVAHEPVIQPKFEVFIEDACTGGAIIGCGDHEHYPNDGVSPFQFVGDDADVLNEDDGIIFTPWTDVATDLTAYIGQQVKVTFRVKDCEGNNNTKDVNGDWISPYNGSHWAYAYFDTYCFPLGIAVPEFCAGDSALTICAPEGFLSYSWPAGQPGIVGSPTTRCVTIANPISGTEYTVNMVSITGCPTTTTVKLKSFPVISTGDTSMCVGTGPINLSAVVEDPVDPPYTYTWSTGASGINVSSVSVNPGTTTTYWVEIANGSGCRVTDTMEVSVIPCLPEVTLVGDTICVGETGTLTATVTGGLPNYTFVYTGGSNPGPGLGTTDPSTDIQTDNPATTTTYTVVITDGNGDKDTATADIVVLPTATGTDVQTACDSLTWIDGNTYTSNNTTATFNIVGGSVTGCDSLVTLNLTISSATTGTDVQTSCDSLVWIDGNTYTSNNTTAQHLIPNGAANGCDSIVTLNLTITPSATGTDTRTSCDSLVWIDGNTYTSNNTTAQHLIPNGAANGCDSTVTLNLTINPSATGTDTRSACNSLLWIDGNTYTTNNTTAQHVIPNGAANGCDSVVTLNLTITSIATGTDTRTVCDTLVWIDGNTYTSNNTTATFNIVGGSFQGCDSLVTLNLTVTGTVQGTDVQAACNSLLWIDGNTYTSNNTTAQHLIPNGSMAGCDSLVTLNLTIVLPPDAGLDGNTTLCQGDPDIDLFTVLNGTPDIGGVWSPALTSGTGIFDPSVDIAGVYTYTVTNAPCPPASATVTISLTPSPTIGSIITTDDNCSNGNGRIVLNSFTGTPPFSLLWNTGATDSILANLTMGTYTVTITDLTGCSASYSPIIGDPKIDCDSIFIPNVFTPYNRDGNNDVFTIAVLGVSKLSAVVYNRWGQKVSNEYTMAGVPDDILTKLLIWDGRTPSGAEVPEGTYYCIVNYTTNGGIDKEHTGYITLFR